MHGTRQSAPSGTSSDQTKPSTETTPAARTGASGKVTATSEITPRTAGHMSDQTFVREASAAGMAEVGAAQEALKKAKRAEVRKAAQLLITDHSAANERLRAIAQKQDIALAASPDAAKANAPVPESGDFDSKYVVSQIKAHQNAIALFRAESENGADDELREFAASTLPTPQHHLMMMQELQ